MTKAERQKKRNRDLRHSLGRNELVPIDRESVYQVKYIPESSLIEKIRQFISSFIKL